MKKFRFSLSNVFVFVVILATGIALRRGLASEPSLWAIWVASFLLFYWISPTSGWRQIARVTATTGTVWSISVLWSYVLCERIDGAIWFAARGFFVALAGVTFTLTSACLVEGARWAWHRWLRMGARHRTFAVSLLLISVAIGWGIWTISRAHYWEPALMATSSESLPLEFAARNLIEQRYGLKDDAHLDTLFVGCADEKLIAVRPVGARKVLVFDAVTGEPAANFSAGEGAWFGSLAFHPDGSALFAILYSTSSGPKLVQWDAATWKPRDHVPIGNLLAPSEPDGQMSFFLDHRFLVVIHFRDAGNDKTKIDIFMADLRHDQFALHTFASATIEPDWFVTAWRNGRIAPRALSWLASPNGKWVATSGKGAPAFRDYLFSREAVVSRLRGRVIGFSSDGNHVIVSEMSERLVWKKKRQSWESPPPFWDYLRFQLASRVAIVNCRNQQTTAQSRWLFEGTDPRLSPDRSRLVSQLGEEQILVWESPAVK